MAIYCIGDIQGCNSELQRLLEQLRFDPALDRIWFVGDIVNRGPESLDALRFVHALGDSAITILGNHDIHLLACWRGYASPKPADTIQEILDAPDCDELLHWLRHQPLMHEDAALGYAMLHAGLYPGWTLADARRLAPEGEAALRAPEDDFDAFMANLYGDRPDRWSPQLEGWDRLRFIINAFTRMRYCDAEKRMLMDYKGAPETRPEGHYPWFETPGRKPVDEPLKVVSGHWSTLGFEEGEDFVTIDTGCLWGGTLTAIRLDGVRERVACRCKGARKPGQ
ncbi:symmetrical bis(5'-nucleosyl)-tetraphosphatase [Aquisalimonas sp. 2447]|uniref:symmetrical bis(5'-nucleosyl)-tetraphosphatase n=1 Tax=Aquisalimonas sp. 2447 TaxID=2740807 RepID=UPI001432545D|nr:symmetrical bis(5'-nucleosyl)-tetraphosphatase [Aquisalimonas sp. 2447]QIT56461.1 symmetrical bis(5'-nucleosyl)-tetraphosphatase [Aquisalimonas sp. 2447]